MVYISTRLPTPHLMASQRLTPPSIDSHVYTSTLTLQVFPLCSRHNHLTPPFVPFSLESDNYTAFVLPHQKVKPSPLFDTLPFPFPCPFPYNTILRAEVVSTTWRRREARRSGSAHTPRIPSLPRHRTTRFFKPNTHTPQNGSGTQYVIFRRLAAYMATPQHTE